MFAATAKSRPPHPTCLHFMASTTSRRVVCHILPIISRSQKHWMCTIYHTTTCPAIHMHLICQFTCIQSIFHSLKSQNRRIKSRSGDLGSGGRSSPKSVGPRCGWLEPSFIGKIFHTDAVGDYSIIHHYVSETP